MDCSKDGCDGASPRALAFIISQRRIVVIKGMGPRWRQDRERRSASEMCAVMSPDAEHKTRDKPFGGAPPAQRSQRPGRVRRAWLRRAMLGRAWRRVARAGIRPGIQFLPQASMRHQAMSAEGHLAGEGGEVGRASAGSPALCDADN